MSQNKIFKPPRIITDSFDQLPRGYYQCCVADPPWPYDNKVTGGSSKSGACQKYDTMTLEDLCKLPVKNIMGENAILYLWITTPLKVEILKSGIIDAWGFLNKTTIYWHKTGRKGLGFYHRGEVEECLVCVRGAVPAWREQTSNWFDAPSTVHSKKPQTFWDDYVFPVVKKLKYDRCVELFSRSPQPDWDAFGNDPNIIPKENDNGS